MIPYCIITYIEEPPYIVAGYRANYPKFNRASSTKPSIEEALAAIPTVRIPYSDVALEGIFKSVLSVAKTAKLMYVQLHSNSELIPFDDYKQLYPEVFI